MNLKEGRRYVFRVEKVVKLESEEYYLLEGPDRKRYLLSCEDYKDYKIRPGTDIDCRIDKINCKGEVYLEPYHPYYRESSTYPFKVVSFEDRIDKSGNMTKVAVVNDQLGNEVIAPLSCFNDTAPVPGDTVSLKIEQIVKGSIIVSGVSGHKGSHREEDGEIFSFTLKGESKGIDGRVYYVVEDSESNVYPLPKEYYIHYGLKVNDTFEGRFVRYKEGHEVSVEPLNPFFEKGLVYEFEVAEFINLGDGFEKRMVLKDRFGFRHQVPFNNRSKPGDIVNYRIEKMRKGWPLLKEM